MILFRIIKNVLLTHYFLFAIVGGAILFFGYKYYSENGKKYEIVSISRGDIVQKVIVNGQTKPVNSVDLAFEVGGTVSSSTLKIGTMVKTGQILAELDDSHIRAELLRAEANVKRERSKLQEIKRGTRPEEISILETQVKNAEVSLADARENLILKIKESYTESEDVIHSSVDQLFNSINSSIPQFNLIISDSELKGEVVYGRMNIEALLAEWKLYQNTGSMDDVLLAESNLNKVNDFLLKVSEAVSIQISSVFITDTMINSYKVLLSEARSSISTAKNNLFAAKEKFNTAQSTLSLALENLSFKKIGNTSEAVSSQEAEVSQALAVVQSVKVQLSKTELRSSQDGIVTVQDAKVGQIVSAGQKLITVISDDKLEIEANVSEINVGKINIGDPVSIRFDAFPGELFTGTVTYIQPAETLVDGVVNYKVTVAFNEDYSKIKSGLTSRLEIITGEKKDVLVIPQYLLFNKEENSYVLKKIDDKFYEVPVILGLKGQNGYAELVSGLSVGDVVGIELVPH